MMAKAHILISGQVQGVGFRYFVKGKLAELGVSGSIENLPDGRVEAEFEGEESKVKEMIEWCREGPPLAKVSRVEVVTK